MADFGINGRPAIVGTAMSAFSSIEGGIQKSNASANRRTLNGGDADTGRKRRTPRLKELNTTRRWRCKMPDCSGRRGKTKQTNCS